MAGIYHHRAMSSSDDSLKLLVDTKSNKVLFAEADKEFVDFLFSLLIVPVGRLISTGAMHGSICRLHQSVKGIGVSYLLPKIHKFNILCPNMTLEIDGYVKELENYMVADNLEVTPLSAISTMELINRFVPHKDGELVEKIVSVGYDECLALLKAATSNSDTVLSDVFLGREK